MGKRVCQEENLLLVTYQLFWYTQPMVEAKDRNGVHTNPPPTDSANSVNYPQQARARLNEISDRFRLQAQRSLEAQPITLDEARVIGNYLFTFINTQNKL